MALLRPPGDHAGVRPPESLQPYLTPPTEDDISDFVNGWRRAIAEGASHYGRGEWLIVRNVLLTGTTDYERNLIRAVFDHLIDLYGSGPEITPTDRKAAEDVFAFALQTVFIDSAADWRKLRTLAKHIDTTAQRRTLAVDRVEQAITLFREGKRDDAMSRIRALKDIDSAFADLDESKAMQWLAGAAPDAKGGAGRRSAFHVTAAIAVSVGALGFKRATGHKPISDAAKVLRDARASLRRARRT